MRLRLQERKIFLFSHTHTHTHSQCVSMCVCDGFSDGMEGVFACLQQSTRYQKRNRANFLFYSSCGRLFQSKWVLVIEIERVYFFSVIRTNLRKQLARLCRLDTKRKEKLQLHVYTDDEERYE